VPRQTLLAILSAFRSVASISWSSLCGDVNQIVVTILLAVQFQYLASGDWQVDRR
jgi:hypothetical protein